MNNVEDRVRSINADSLTEEQLESVIAQVSDKIVALVDGVCEKSNRLLSIYGLEAKMEIRIQRKGA